MRFLIVCLGYLMALSVNAQQKPKLVVGIVVDQMRHDYLQRFESKFSEGGFKRMMRDGFEARNTNYNYVPTKTGPGHASIYTGTTPKYHGIIANDWFSRELGYPINCVQDTSVTNIGGSPSLGKVSPINLQATTLTDQLILASNFQSKVVSISLKDRGAVLPAGHNPTGAYWYDHKSGVFMTSSYYKDKLPSWLVDFNDQRLVDKLSNETWSPLIPLAEYIESTEDNTSYERGFKGKDTPIFPYVLKDLRKYDRFGIIQETPFGNTLLLELAKSAIDGEKLGSGSFIDFLAISFSSTDKIGHNFGPNSIEIEDTYLRLDFTISELLIHLDRQIGEGNYLVFLTSDHAVVENPQFLADHKLDGGYYDLKPVISSISEALRNQFGEGEWILDVSNHQVYLNRPLIKEKDLSLEVVQDKVKVMLLEQNFISEAMTATALENSDFTDRTNAALQRGFNTKLSGDVLFETKAGYLPDSYQRKGSDHGSSYTYDTHVPLLFFGTGIPKGSTERSIAITDIAPTISLLLDISLPNACTGQPILELFE